MVQYMDHVEILGPNAISHDLYLLNGISQHTDCTNNGNFQNGYVQNGFKSTSFNSNPSWNDSDADMHCDEVQETTDNQFKPDNHYLNQPVRCLSLCGHLQ